MAARENHRPLAQNFHALPAHAGQGAGLTTGGGAAVEDQAARMTKVSHDVAGCSGRRCTRGVGAGGGDGAANGRDQRLRE